MSAAAPSAHMDGMISFIFFLLLGTVAGVILSRLFNKWNAR